MVGASREPQVDGNRELPLLAVQDFDGLGANT
jgi:hypothetical protein